jgi:hypothetical protein
LKKSHDQDYDHQNDEMPEKQPHDDQQTSNETENTQIASTSAPQETYPDYVKRYCLHYIRTFFNQHLDDQWFRQRYSPLECKRFIKKEQYRAIQEAATICSEIQNEANTFVLDARLGGGVKPPTNHHHHHHNHESFSLIYRPTTSRKRKYYNSTSDAPESSLVIDPSVPKSHLISFVKENRILRIMDIPSHVNDQQLLLALKDHSDERNVANSDNSKNNKIEDTERGSNFTTTATTTNTTTGAVTVIGNIFPIEIYSSSVVDGVCSAIHEESDTCIHKIAAGSSSHHHSSEMLYHRDAWAIFESEAAKVRTHYVVNCI